MKKLCLLSISASHYRSLIYQLMDKQLHCDFIFGKDDTSVKQMDTSRLSHSRFVPNKYLVGKSVYYQKGTLALTKGYKCIINDLSIMCLTSWAVLFMAKFRGQKVYQWDHGWYGRESLLKKILKRLYFGLADGTFLYGNYARNLMIENGFNAEKLHVIHNSLNYDRELDIRSKFQPSSIYSEHFHNNLPVLLFIGRLTAVKQLDMLVSAVSLLKKKGSPCNLVFVGDGPVRSSLETEVHEAGLEDCVWFYGPCYDEEKNALFIFNAAVCVSPGNVGLTAIHAMMYGCPVITHNDLKWQMPEFEAIKDKTTGTFFERGNVESLASAIESWLEAEPGRRELIRQACYKEIDEEWNPHRQIKIMKEVIYG